MYARHSVYIWTVFVHNTIVYPLTQVWGMFYQLLIAFSCIGYSSPGNEPQYQHTATVFASGSNCMQDDDHAWWKEGVLGRPNS